MATRISYSPVRHGPGTNLICSSVVSTFQTRLRTTNKQRAPSVINCRGGRSRIQKAPHIRHLNDPKGAGICQRRGRHFDTDCINRFLFLPERVHFTYDHRFVSFHPAVAVKAATMINNSELQWSQGGLLRDATHLFMVVFFFRPSFS